MVHTCLLFCVDDSYLFQSPVFKYNRILPPGLEFCNIGSSSNGDWDMHNTPHSAPKMFPTLMGCLLCLGHVYARNFPRFLLAPGSAAPSSARVSKRSFSLEVLASDLFSASCVQDLQPLVDWYRLHHYFVPCVCSCVVMCMWCAWLVMCLLCSLSALWCYLFGVLCFLLCIFGCHLTIFVVFAGALSFIMCEFVFSCALCIFCDVK